MPQPRVLLGALTSAFAAAVLATTGSAQESVAAAQRQKYVALTRGWAADAVLTSSDLKLAEAGRARERQVTESLDDAVATEILSAGEPSFDRLAAVYPGKILDRGVLGSYSDPRGTTANGDEFVIWWNGAISANLIKGPAAADSKRIVTLAENTNVLFRVGPSAEMFGRVADRFSRVSYENGYLPIVHATYLSDEVEYRETAFAAAPPSGAAGPDTAFINFELKNTSRSARVAELHEDIVLIDGTRAELSGNRLRDATGATILAINGGNPAFDPAAQRLTERVTLQPGAVAAVTIAVPYAPDRDGRITAPQPGEFDAMRERLRESSIERLASGMAIDVPETRVNDFWRALVLQNFILADGPRFTYGSGLVYNEATFPFETGFAALVMARYGFTDAAESWLSYLIPASVERDKAGWRYQNRRAIPLHLVYQFYLLTGDTRYFDAHKQELFRVADEIVSDRHSTMTSTDPKPLHWGLLPPSRPGVDAIASTRETYVVAHDITNAQGLQDFGEFLVRSGIDRERGERYRREAADFRACLIRAMNASIVRSPGKRPFVPLQTLYFRDTPDYGPEPFDNMALGRVQGTYEHYWDDMEFRYDFFDPGDPLGRAIADYVQHAGGFVLGVTRARPRAGQPYGWINANYNAGYYEYALRGGDVGRFLLGFYSRLAFAASRNFYVASEGAPLIGYNTEHGGFVSPEYSFPNSAANAETLDMLRAMLVREEREHNEPTGVIALAQGTPRLWLEDGKRMLVRAAPTEFGLLSFSIESHVGSGEIAASVDPPKGHYRELRLYLRHPQSLTLRRVRVNGRPHPDFNPADGYISLRPGRGRFTIDASFAAPQQH
jgi:hypothetical protein